jgi:hypothetical protein
MVKLIASPPATVPVMEMPLMAILKQPLFHRLLVESHSSLRSAAIANRHFGLSLFRVGVVIVDIRSSPKRLQGEPGQRWFHQGNGDFGAGFAQPEHGLPAGQPPQVWFGAVIAVLSGEPK